ncbi:E3 ubiquitin- ligase PDZRN3 [Paramuricea clavata]|uniref:E3 ubiquitin- ligase PDZRN3 n=1 Tax=Paramuricea clavata TaxID=317549 RepID=A0A7D9JKC6_PARCT|nr:E3 ubiquitin- ligase PDZRN3 [Paramuricea clavata]
MFNILTLQLRMATRAILEAGFDENRFESPVSENFKCSICLNVLNEPKSCRNNQHYFCFGCIGQHLENYHTCPECMEELTPETLGTPPRVLMNCIAELPIKCNYSERGCSDRVQLGRLQNHLDQCGFAPVTCSNDGCEMKINKRDRIHHETELCEVRRVQCHNCGEMRKEMVKLGEKQDQFNKSQTNLEVKIDQVSTRLQNMEKNVITKVNELYLANQRENAVVVDEIGKVKSFMNDVLLKLNSISTVVCEMQAAKKEESQQNQRENLQNSRSRASLLIKKFGHVAVYHQQKMSNNASAPGSNSPNLSEAQISSNSDTASDPVSHSRRPAGSPECQSLSNSEPQIKDAGMYAEATCPESQTSSHIERSRSPDLVSWRRFTTAGDVTSAISDFSTYLLPKRSRSSDAIRNEFLDATQSSKISPSQERGSQELDRRSKDRSRLHHSGSYDHLNSRSTTSTQTRDLTHYLVDFSPASPDPSPRSERRSSPGKGSPFAPASPQHIDIGMTVLVSRNRGRLCKGIVQYVGCLPDHGNNVYVGLELHDADGKNDGVCQGQRFFTCQPNHGVFVLFENVVMAYT